MENDSNLLQLNIPRENSRKIVDVEAFLSTCSSTSLSDIEIDQTKPKKRTKTRVYDTIGKFLLKNRFYLTALEFYTELLENGYDLPRLRDYFSNPTNFEGTTTNSFQKSSPFVRNLPHYADDSISLGGGATQNDFLLRTSSCQTFDSTSIDNVTRLSEDIDTNNGPTTTTFNDERVAVLEFELRKARDTIQELRQSLTVDSTTTNNNDLTKNFTGFRTFQRRTLNFLINEYLLTNNYKLTSVTFGEENDGSDLEDWQSVGLNCSRPPDLSQLYRWYCHQMAAVEEKSTFVNFDKEIQENFSKVEENFQKTKSDLNEFEKRLTNLDEEKNNLNEQIRELQHEKKNLLFQLEFLQNRLSNETKIDSTMEMNSTRQLSTVYLRKFEREILRSSTSINDDRQSHEDIEFHHDEDEKMSEEILEELNRFDLDQTYLLDLIVRTVTKMNVYLHGTKKLDLVPLIVYTSILHSNSQDRDRLLKLLFNLYKKPSFYQRRVLLHACLAFAKQSGPIRVHAELLPQCWENLSNKIDERRCFVAETCGILSPHLSNDIRVSLIFSILQQMLIEDKCEQVRASCSQSLALVINQIDDQSRLSQCFELLDRCLTDTNEVVQTTKRFLLPSIGMWCFELNKISSLFIEHFLKKLETIGQTTPSDQQRFVQLISVLTDLIVFLFASILKNLTIKDEICSTTTTTLRQLPENGHPSEFYHLKQILSSQTDSLLEIYDRCASNGEFPFDEQIQTELDDFLKRSFDAMLTIDIQNNKIVHGSSEFIKTFGRYFGRNFWKLKIKPIYQNQTDAAIVLYATGVLSSWATEQERAELTQYVYDALLLVANQKYSIQILQAIYAELGSDRNFQESLLNILRDSLTNTNPQIRLYTLQLFNVVLSLVDSSIVSHKILPALITLASDDDLNVRIATISVFGTILIQSSQTEILERVYAQFQMFDSDPTFREEHRVQTEFIKTFTQIARHAENRFREEFILPYLASIASQNSQQDRSTGKRLEIATVLFEAYSALSCASNSGQAILHSFLPGLYCLRVDFAQLRPDSVTVLDSIIKDLEHKLEQHRQNDNSLLTGGMTNLNNQENIRGRMLKGLTTFRDSTEKLTYRFMKKK